MAFSKEAVLRAAKQFVTFVNKTPSPYHAVDEIKQSLLAAGFQELHESDHWTLEQSKKYFVTRNQSCIIAFAVGGQYTPGNGFSIVGAHTDSPCLKLKPISKRIKSGYLMVGVQCYGGGIWSTWFDRDLTVAGRVLVKTGDKIQHRLAYIKKPILRIPHLAIHLQRDVNEQFGPNKENHLCPILATAVQAEMQGSATSDLSTQCDTQESKHHTQLITLLCDELHIKPEQIMDFELFVADTQPASIGGVYDEFIFSPRLDNLLNCYCAFQALIDSCTEKSLQEEPNIRMISLFDNEEVGSVSAQGAESTFQQLVLSRICQGNALAFEESMPKSFMISADQAHAVHPNYLEKHDGCHQPALHKGFVLKINANQRYATTAITSTVLRELALSANVPLQDFVVRNDSPCGSTIGPIISAKLGIPTVDVGAPQLSMHSIREQGCTTGISHGIALFKVFFEDYPRVFKMLDF